jgi:opacity protein-like surface antigen
MRLLSKLSMAAVLAVALTSGAVAQNWSIDTSGVGAGGSAEAKPKRARQGESGAKAAKAENRQFGELEGWSPGKSPPKKKEEDKSSRLGGSAPVSMTPSGGMAVGMPF